MKTDRDRMEPEMEAMMMRAPFAGLTAGEQELALAAFGSAGAYDAMRAALVAARSALREAPSVEPRPQTLDALHAAMRRREPSRLPARRWSFGDLLSYRIPVWQPIGAMAALALVAVVYLLGRGEGVRERIVYVQVPAAERVAPVVAIDTESIVQRVVDSLKEELAREAGMKSLGADAPARRVARSIPAVVANDRSSDRRIADAKAREAIDTALRSSSGSAHSSGAALYDNRFIGLGNMPGLDRQRRGKSIAEDSAIIGRFRSRMVMDRL